jgi:hypothetical protein
MKGGLQVQKPLPDKNSSRIGQRPVAQSLVPVQLGEQVPQQFEPRVHEREPRRMLQIVVVMLEGAPGIVRRVNRAALDAPGVIRQQRFQRVEVVP